jgi:hypothetical protein
MEVRGDKAIRDALGIPSAVTMIEQAERESPAWLWTGLGNTAVNDFCPAWKAGELYYTARDQPRLEAGWAFDACIWENGEQRRLRMEQVSFVRREKHWAPYAGKELLENAELVVCGQRLVERGIAIDPATDAEGRYAASYVDKRHLIMNAYTPLIDRKTRATAVDSKGPIRRDFGLDQILANPPLLKDAIEGRIVRLPLQLRDVDGTEYDVAETELASAFFEKSYRQCASSEELRQRESAGERGSYYIDGAKGFCELVYARALYSQHVLAIRENGDTELVDCVVGGASNIAGCAVSELAGDLQECGFREAILLDQGGDAVMCARQSLRDRDWADPNGEGALVPSSLGRTQWAALMLYQGNSSDGIRVGYDGDGSDGYYRVVWR